MLLLLLLLLHTVVNFYCKVCTYSVNFPFYLFSSDMPDKTADLFIPIDKGVNNLLQLINIFS